MEQGNSTTSAHEFVLDDFLAPPVDKNGKFRLKSTMMFLTYSRCDLDKQVVFDLLVMNGVKFDSYMFARELHKDGFPHLHVLLKNHQVQFQVTSEKHFNVLRFHPNIRKVKPGPGHLERVIGYLRKYDPECLTNMKPSQCYNTKEGVYREAIQAPTPKKAQEIIMEGDPEGYVKNHKNQVSFLAEIAARKPVEPWVMPPHFVPYNYPDQVLRWAQQIGRRQDRYKLLMIMGTSSLGKTRMMLSLAGFLGVLPGLHLAKYPLMSEMERPGYSYVIWDDIHWSPSEGTNKVHPEHFRAHLLGDELGSLARHTHLRNEKRMVNVPSVVLMNPEHGTWFWNYCHRVDEWKRECIFLQLGGTYVYARPPEDPGSF